MSAVIGWWLLTVVRACVFVASEEDCYNLIVYMSAVIGWWLLTVVRACVFVASEEVQYGTARWWTTDIVDIWAARIHR